MDQKALVDYAIQNIRLTNLLNVKHTLADEIAKVGRVLEGLNLMLKDSVKHTNDYVLGVNNMPAEQLATVFSEKFYDFKRYMLDTSVSPADFILDNVPMGLQRNMLISNYENKIEKPRSIKVYGEYVLQPNVEVPSTMYIQIEIETFKCLKAQLVAAMKDIDNTIANLSKN